MVPCTATVRVNLFLSKWWHGYQLVPAMLASTSSIRPAHRRVVEHGRIMEGIVSMLHNAFCPWFIWLAWLINTTDGIIGWHWMIRCYWLLISYHSVGRSLVSGLISFLFSIPAIKASIALVILWSCTSCSERWCHSKEKEVKGRFSSKGE